MFVTRSTLFLTGLLFAFLTRAGLCQETTVGGSRYYQGVGEDANLDKARSSALQRLLENIQVFVSSSSNRSIIEKSEGLQEAFTVQSIARSSLKLHDVQESVTSLPDDRYRVTKSVSRESVRNLFNQRKAHVHDLLTLAANELAQPAAAGVNIGTALKYYYWALLLSEIHPDTITFVPPKLPQL